MLRKIMIVLFISSSFCIQATEKDNNGIQEDFSNKQKYLICGVYFSAYIGLAHIGGHTMVNLLKKRTMANFGKYIAAIGGLVILADIGEKFLQSHPNFFHSLISDTTDKENNVNQ